MTFGGGEMTGGEMTMGRNDRIPRVYIYFLPNDYTEYYGPHTIPMPKLLQVKILILVNSLDLKLIL